MEILNQLGIIMGILELEARRGIKEVHAAEIDRQNILMKKMFSYLQLCI